MAPPVSFGHWIRQQRRALDLTQYDLAVRVGCSVSAIRKIEADERRPSRQVAELLAEILHIPSTDRPAFLKVARMELAYDHLGTISVPEFGALALPPPSHLSAGEADAAAVLKNGDCRPRVRSLPVPPTPLVGRKAEVARICEILSDPECRMLTLTGPGGVGKTRLAIAAAERLAPGMSDAVCFVPLAAVTTEDSILTAVAAALGLRLHATDNLPAQLASYLQSRQMLLVLDNLEHLLEGAASIDEIVQVAPGVQVLVTSREQLGLTGEWVLEIHGLSVSALPQPIGDGPLPGWPEGSAFTLFLQAARRADPEFVPAAADYAPIEHICRMVEGSPLGIELAAAWVRLLTCREIAAEIERSYDFLATSARDVPPRQRSLRAGFEHSWRLLSLPEQRVLQGLSVFAGGFTRKAGEMVAGAGLQDLAALIAKSLVVRTTGGRYDLHAIVRQYAAEKLEETGEAEAAARRHWNYFLGLARDVDAARNSPQYMALVDQLELESDNLQAALRYLVERDEGAACQLAAVLEPYWIRRPVREAEQRLERFAEAHVPCSESALLGARARVLLVLAALQGSLSGAMAMMHKALTLARQANDRRTTALALAVLGNEVMVVAGLEGGEACFAEAQCLAEEDGDKATLVTVYVRQADYARHMGRHARAIELYTAGVTLAQEIGRFDLALAGLFSLGLMAMRQGNPQKAVALVEPNLGMWDALHDRVELGHAYNLLARAVMMQGDYDRALTLIDQGEAIFCETGFDGSNYIALSRGDAAYALGRVAAARTFYERALELSKDDFDPMVVTLSQQGIARCAIRQNDLAAAQGAIERSRQVCEAMHEGWARVLIEFTAAELAWLSSHQALAEEHLRTGLQQVLPLGDCNAMAEGLELWAALLASTARPAQAVRLLGAADALRREIGAPVMPIDKERIQAAIADSRSALGAEAFAAAWEFGETQAQAGLQQVIELALNKS